MIFKNLIEKLFAKTGGNNTWNDSNASNQDIITDEEHVIVSWKANIDNFIKNYQSSMQWRIYNKDKKILTNITLDYTGNGTWKEINIRTNWSSWLSVKVND